MLAIGLLFVRMLCDCFKPRPRWKPKSWYCDINSTCCSSARRAVDCICVGSTAPQGRTLHAPDRAVRRHYCAADPWRTTPSICTNLSSRGHRVFDRQS